MRRILPDQGRHMTDQMRLLEEQQKHSQLWARRMDIRRRKPVNVYRLNQYLPVELRTQMSESDIREARAAHASERMRLR